MSKENDYFRRNDTPVVHVLNRISDNKVGSEWRQSTTKRVVETAVTVPMALAAAPLIAGFSAAIIATERENPFYVQERLSQNEEKPVKVIKLKSMHAGSDRPEVFGELGRCDENGKKYTDDNDPRVTLVGKVIRKRELDELPQLFSVFKGDLALVENRAIAPQDYVRLKDQSEVNKLLGMNDNFDAWDEQRPNGKPGIFHLQAAFDPQRKESQRRRYRWDTFYSQHASLGLDLYILYKNLSKLLRRKKALVEQHEEIKTSVGAIFNSEMISNNVKDEVKELVKAG